jgi:osmotically-inducible protein OsmY
LNSDVRYGFLMRLLSIAVLLALVTPLFAQKTKTPVTDDVIVDQVRVKIADDSEVGGQPISVDAHNGVVVLTGKVTNDKLKAKVEKIAKKVKGVTGVDNKLAISPN